MIKNENTRGQLAMKYRGLESSEKEKQQVLETAYIELDDEPGNISGKLFLNLNTTFEWKSPLSSKQKRFAFLYATAFLNNTLKGNKIKIAIKAGFSSSTAQKNLYQIIQDPKMVEAIQSIIEQLKKKDLNEYIEEKDDASDSLYIETEGGKIIDLNTFDWDETINNIQKKFIFFFIFPFPNSIKGNGVACAAKAGYKQAYLASWRLLRDPKVISQMEKLKAKIKEGTSGKDLVDLIKASAEVAIAIKMQIINTSPLDFYNFFLVVNENGIEEIKVKAKPPEEIPEEKKMLIEDIQYVGKNGEVHYKLPSKSKAEADVLSLYKDLCCNDKEKDDDGYDVDLTYSIIKDNVKVRTETMKKNEERLNKLRHHFKYTPPEAAAQQER